MKTQRFGTFLNGEIWPDQQGVHINAHGGGILFHQGRYYWYGEHKVAGTAGNAALVGVHVYSSPDLMAWKDEGIALSVSEDPTSDICKGCVLERPKVLFNSRTGKFVLWFHLELRGRGYEAARCGVAVSDSPVGPFRFLGSLRPNAGALPRATHFSANLDIEFDGHEQDYFLKRDLPGGQMARDMGLFQDEDGTAYLIFASEENRTLHLSRLSDDYLAHTGDYVRIFPGRSNEAPALCAVQGHYWMMTSGCTGWAPNPARAATAPSLTGPWTELPNPCRGTNPANGLGPEKTFGGQSTFILRVETPHPHYVALFDLWRPDNAIDGRYIWLPIDFTSEPHPVIRWTDRQAI